MTFLSMGEVNISFGLHDVVRINVYADNVYMTGSVCTKRGIRHTILAIFLILRIEMK